MRTNKAQVFTQLVTALSTTIKVRELSCYSIRNSYSIASKDSKYAIINIHNNYTL